MDIVVNWWAVLGAAAASIAIGALWYGPLFGKIWMKLSGLTKDGMRSMPLSVQQAMLAGFVTSLLMAWVLAHFVYLFGAFDGAGARELAFWIWLGFFVPLTAGAWIWEGKSFRLFVLNAAHWLIALFVMTWILARWA